MKKYLFLAALLIAGIGLVSWGALGHRVVGLIAENHLSPRAKEGVKKLLGRESLADVASWADEVDANPAFKYTAAYHYINLPVGLNYDEFVKMVVNDHKDNVYKATLQAEHELEDPKESRSNQVSALKFLVHFVGDLHQPMHVSREEDRGGNRIQVYFMNQALSLHSLWDSGLLEYENLNATQLTKKIDTANAVQIDRWQHDDLMKWLYESYQISNILYKEAEEDTQFGEQYYKEHLPVVELRLEKAGVRLAGILNRIYSR